MKLITGIVPQRAIESMNDSLRIIKRYAGMKGDKRKVKKGFAMATPESQKSLVNRRWERYREEKEREAKLQAVQE